MKNTVKKHITWPRTGYVALSRWGNPLWRRFFACTCIAVAGVVFVVIKHLGAASHTRADDYVVLLLPAYAYWVFRMGREYPWKWLVVIFMAAGLLAISLFLPSDSITKPPLEMLFVGLVWFLSGAATLVSYLRHTQPPAEETK